MLVVLGFRPPHGTLTGRRSDEVHNHEEFTDGFELHWIELPSLASAIDAGEEPELVKWAKLLKAESDEELEQLAMTSQR